MAMLVVRAGEPFPPWVFSHYLNASEINYRKTLLFHIVLDLLQAGAWDADFKVARSSIDLYQLTPLRLDEFRKFATFHSKATDYKEFWRLVRNLERPAVFYRRRPGKEYEPLLLLNGPEALRIKDARLQSPFKITLEGLAQGLETLLYMRKRNRRDEERHQAQMRALDTANEREQVALRRDRVAHVTDQFELIAKIEASNISRQAKAEIRRHALGIMENQRRQNESIEAEFEVLPDDGPSKSQRVDTNRLLRDQ